MSRKTEVDLEMVMPEDKQMNKGKSEMGGVFNMSNNNHDD